MRFTLVAVLAVLVVPASAQLLSPDFGPVNSGDAHSVSAVNLGGAPVICQLASANGFYFEMNPAYIRPLVYDFIKKLGGIPTQDGRQAAYAADFSFQCFSPQESWGSVNLNSWSTELGLGLRSEKWVVRTYVTIYECRGLAEEQWSSNSANLVRGMVVAGPFVGIGKESTISEWEAFLGKYNFLRGVELNFGQSQWGSDREQFKALMDSLSSLRPATATAAVPTVPVATIPALPPLPSP